MNYYYIERLRFWIKKNVYINVYQKENSLELGINYLQGIRSNHQSTMLLALHDELIIKITVF